MYRIDALEVACRFGECPVKMDAMAASDDAGWWNRERADSWQNNTWWLVDVRDDGRNLAERFHIAALPAREPRSARC